MGGRPPIGVVGRPPRAGGGLPPSRDSGGGSKPGWPVPPPKSARGGRTTLGTPRGSTTRCYDGLHIWAGQPVKGLAFFFFFFFFFFKKKKNFFFFKKKDLTQIKVI
jgi:hypothetical protein